MKDSSVGFRKYYSFLRMNNCGIEIYNYLVFRIGIMGNIKCICNVYLVYKVLLFLIVKMCFISDLVFFFFFIYFYDLNDFIL